jgi:hypothetical protein
MVDITIELYIITEPWCTHCSGAHLRCTDTEVEGFPARPATWSYTQLYVLNHTVKCCSILPKMH